MSNTIFGREAELKILSRLLSSQKAEFLAVYGRRRVGKTYLIQQFFKDKGVFFSVTGTAHSSKKIQIKNFFRELWGSFPTTKEASAPKDWDEALYLLKEAISQIEPTQKVILFFDELPWLASNRSGFLAALEYMWNQHFSQMNHLILIVCGSAASWIIKKVINNKGGLYGRLSEIIKLHAFSLDETEKFLLSRHIQLSRKLIVELYMSLGGIAKYLTYVHPGESTAQTINRLCFTPQGQLVGEFHNLYQALFDNAEIHLQIVKALAEKKMGISQKELLEKLKIPSGGHASSILEELEESGFITTCPEFQKKTKEKKLWLIDEYSHFYMTWIEPIRGSIVLGHDPDYWLKMQNDPRWKSWSGYAFESVCFKHIPQIKRALGIGSVLTVESHWSHRPEHKLEKGAQIDLVIDRKDDCINLCEIKFQRGPFAIDATYAQELAKKIAVFREQTKTTKTLFLTLITPFGLESNQHSIELVHSEITLEAFFRPLT
jgi:AAA+ ATPase superfamily predicted ATPase